MKRVILLCLLLVFLLCSPALAEGKETSAELQTRLKKTADRVCPIFAKSASAFQEIKADDWVSCGFTTDPKMGVSKDAKCITQKIKGYDKPVKLTISSGWGSCQSSGVIIVEGIDPPSLKRPEIVNYGSNGYGFGKHDKILKIYDGGDVLVTNDIRSDLRIVTTEGQYVLCGFRNVLLGYSVTSWNSASVCEKFANDDFEDSLIDIGEGLENLKAADSLYGDGLPPETHVKATAQVDLDRDGQDEKVLLTQLSSGRGCGCELAGLSLAKAEVKNITEAEKINAGLQELTELNGNYCHVKNSWSPVVIDGVAYIGQNSWKIDNIKGQPQFSAREFPDRVLYKYQNGYFAEVCRLKPQIKRVLAHEVVPKELLNYKPIE